MMRERADLGLVTHLTMREMNITPQRLATPATVVSACENPQVLQRIADAGVGQPVVCFSGNPSVVGLMLAERVQLRYHADFDWPGIAIAARLIEAGALPWRISAQDYADAVEISDARLHLAPYTDPHFEIAVASTITPAGVMTAGKHGIGVLSLGAGLPGGPEALSNQWKIAEETAAKHGKTMDRKNWRLVVNVHVSDDDEKALQEVGRGERHETISYFEDTLGRPPGRADDPLREGVKMGTTLIGAPDTVMRDPAVQLAYVGTAAT